MSMQPPIEPDLELLAGLGAPQGARGPGCCARVGSWTARATTGGTTQAGRFMGIDRLDFPTVAFWREDFASASLGALMNDLAFSPDGVLVPRDFMAKEVLNVGDRLTLYVDVAGRSLPVDLTIVGAFDLFPTWYPDSGPLFVGNLDYFFLQIQGQHPYNIWLKTTSEVECPPLVGTLRNNADLGLDVQSCISARQKLIQEQKRPEHQGLVWPALRRLCQRRRVHRAGFPALRVVLFPTALH